MSRWARRVDRVDLELAQAGRVVGVAGVEPAVDIVHNADGRRRVQHFGLGRQHGFIVVIWGRVRPRLVSRNLCTV